MGEYEVIVADVLEALTSMPDASFDGCLTDPPYGIRFRGHAWDYDVPSVEVWREIARVLKPGALVAAFGGPRTEHRAAVAIEDAGLVPFDKIMWLYGTGQPHSLDLSKALDAAVGAERPVIGARPIAYADSPSGYTSTSANSTARRGGFWVAPSGETQHGRPVTAPVTDLAKAWNGYGTNLKPGYEPVILARKPLDGTYVENIGRWGVGGLAIDACRLESGRYPTNVLVSEEALECVGDGRRTFYCPRVGKAEGKDNPHPNRKPIRLTTYLATLIRPPTPRRILVPFAGSGSEMLGARTAGWEHVVGIEHKAEYAEIARRRLVTLERRGTE